jgi:ParB-like chromosome segregation protein Spo0J
MSNDPKILGSFKAQAANSEVTGVKKTDLFRVRPQELHHEPGFNERDYNDPDVIAQIEGFCHSFMTGEFEPPLVVRIDPLTGPKFLVDGHQRHKGALLAIERGHGVEHLDCIPVRGSDADRVVVQLTSERGLKLKPLGIAMNYLKLLRMGKDNAEIAARVNRTVTHVESMLVLATANSDVHALVKADAVSASGAIEAVRAHGEKAGEFLKAKLAQAQANGKTRVKAAAIKDWAPPRMTAMKIYNSISPVFDVIARNPEWSKLLDRDSDFNPDKLKGKSVILDAAAVVAICREFKAAKAMSEKRNGQSDESAAQDDAAGPSE